MINRKLSGVVAGLLLVSCVDKSEDLPLEILGSMDDVKYTLEVRRVELDGEYKACESCKPTSAFVQFIFRFERAFDVRECCENVPRLVVGEDSVVAMSSGKSIRDIEFRWLLPPGPPAGRLRYVDGGTTMLPVERAGLIWDVPFEYDADRVPVIERTCVDERCRALE